MRVAVALQIPKFTGSEFHHGLCNQVAACLLVGAGGGGGSGGRQALALCVLAVLAAVVRESGSLLTRDEVLARALLASPMWVSAPGGTAGRATNRR